MKTILLAVFVLAAPAFAGETYLGTIVSVSGADTTNATGSTATPFVIPEGSKLTMYCTTAVNICTDTLATCTVLGGANPGVQWSAATNFPTSVDQIRRVSVLVGTARSSVVRIVGAAAVTCYVWARNGNE